MIVSIIIINAIDKIAIFMYFIFIFYNSLLKKIIITRIKNIKQIDKFIS